MPCLSASRHVKLKSGARRIPDGKTIMESAVQHPLFVCADCETYMKHCVCSGGMAKHVTSSLTLASALLAHNARFPGCRASHMGSGHPRALC